MKGFSFQGSENLGKRYVMFILASLSQQLTVRSNISMTAEEGNSEADLSIKKSGFFGK